MPEGDTIFRTAVQLRKALLGRTVQGFDTDLETVAAVLERRPVVGRTVSAVEPRGKHLLIHFSAQDLSGGNADDLVLHTHMRMTGAWHLYRLGERWQKPQRLARVVIHTDAYIAPCFSAPVVELLTAMQTRQHSDLTALGPDAITAEFDPEVVLARLRRYPDVPIGVAVMNQQILAGVGNVYKSELLFLRRMCPFDRVGSLDDPTLRLLIDEAARLLQLNRNRGIRRTHFGLNERARVWVYGRTGEPCRVCGTPVRSRRQGIDARMTYYCPTCQPPSALPGIGSGLADPGP